MRVLWTPIDKHFALPHFQGLAVRQFHGVCKDLGISIVTTHRDEFARESTALIQVTDVVCGHDILVSRYLSDSAHCYYVNVALARRRVPFLMTSRSWRKEFRIAGICASATAEYVIELGPDLALDRYIDGDPATGPVPPVNVGQRKVV